MLAPIPQKERQRIKALHINADKLGIRPHISQVKGDMVMGQKLAVVVTGATGKQGGAVVKSLLERGHEVRAVTRTTDSAKARELANAGITLVRASLEDTAALTRALEGATSLFAMTTPFEGGTQAETRQGISAANAAKAAGVHLVFTSGRLRQSTDGRSALRQQVRGRRAHHKDRRTRHDPGARLLHGKPFFRQRA